MSIILMKCEDNARTRVQDLKFLEIIKKKKKKRTMTALEFNEIRFTPKTKL